MNKLFTKIATAIAGFTMVVGVGAVVISKQAKGVYADDYNGIINFGPGEGCTKIDNASDSGDDSLGNTWTITTVGTSSFTNNNGWTYSQIGSGSKPATSVTFTTTLDEAQTISSFSAKFGGFNNAEGTVTLKVGNTTVGSGSLSGSDDVVINNTVDNESDDDLTVTVTGISKGIKAYYISYSYSTGGGGQGQTSYTVTYNSLGGTEIDARSVTEGGTIASLPTPTKNPNTTTQTKYSFEGWYILSNSDNPSNPSFEGSTQFTSSTHVNSDLTLYAKYNETHYNIITFDTNGGSDVDSVEVDNGGTVAKPDDPTKNGYSFEGWYTLEDVEYDFNSIVTNSNFTLYARWTSFAIQENGVFVKITSTEELINNGKYLIASGTKVFNGSTSTLDTTNNVFEVSVNGTQIAKDENTAVAYFTIDTTNHYIKSASGYYIGRTTSSNGLDTSAVPNSDYVNAISFDANGNAVIAITAQSVTLRYNSSSNQNRFRYFTANQQPVQLYKFVRMYTVSFNTNGGNPINSATVLDGQLLTLPSAPTRAPDAENEYEFAGWYIDENLETPFVESNPITSNLTLFAKYNSTPIDNPVSYLSTANTIETISANETRTQGNVNRSIIFSNLGLTDGEKYSEPFDGNGFTVTFAGGANDGRYYNTGSGIRTYGGGTITIASSHNITNLVLTWDGNNKPSNANNVNVGTYNTETGVWTGSSKSIVFTRPSGSGHWRLQSIQATYYGEIVTFDTVALRFGGVIPVSAWTNINSKWEITDYGVMFARATMLTARSKSTLEEVFRNNPADVAKVHRNVFVAPVATGEDYIFTARLNLEESDYDAVFYAAPYIVAGGQYYFFPEEHCSVRSLAYECLNGQCSSSLSTDTLTTLKGSYVPE